MSFLHDVYRTYTVIERGQPFKQPSKITLLLYHISVSTGAGMGEMAAALGESADEKHYKSLLTKLKPEWHQAFWDPEISAYSTGTQMAQAAAIWLDDLGEGHLVPPANMAALVQKLGDDCKSRGVTIGFVGVRYMFEALAKQNATDAALACIARPGYPGFHYEIYNEYEPSSSLWESWNVNTQKCITCETSRDHHYRAAINTFLRKYVAGLDMPPGKHDWSLIKVRPEAAHSTLSSASVAIETHRGMVHTSWARGDGGLLTMELTVLRVTLLMLYSARYHNARLKRSSVSLCADACRSRCHEGVPERCTFPYCTVRRQSLQRAIRLCGARRKWERAMASCTWETMGASRASTRTLVTMFS